MIDAFVTFEKRLKARFKIKHLSLFCVYKMKFASPVQEMRFYAPLHASFYSLSNITSGKCFIKQYYLK